MNLKDYFNEKTIKNVLNILIFFIVLAILFMWYKYVETKFSEQNKIEKERLEILLQEKDKQISKLEFLLSINSLNLLADDSITKFVNNKVSYSDIRYVPENLVSVWSDHIVDWKGWYIKVRKVLKDALVDLSKQFYEDTNNNIVVVSWYRSYNYQKWIKDRGCPDSLCAKAWYSEHQSGLTIDIYSASSEKNWANNNNLKKHFFWFKDNAYKYGFHNTYQKWLSVDWYKVEPWHWRYVWKDLSKYLYEKDMTIAEFYNKKH
jgi:D-alanyl-D-alanine carboxypeptidase